MTLIDENAQIARENEIHMAQDVLKGHGFFTEMMWSIEDVQMNFECTDEEAFDVLRNAFNNDYLSTTINEMIEEAAEQYKLLGLTRKKEED